MMRRFSILLLSLSLVLILSCSNQENQPTGPEEKTNLPKVVELSTVAPPSALLESNEQEAKRALEYFKMINGFVKLKEAINPPEYASVKLIDGYWSGNWKYEDVVFYWEAWYEGEMYMVEVAAEGSFYGYEFSKTKFLAVNSSEDGRLGYIGLYGPNGFKLSEWDWELKDGEVYSIEYYAPLGGLIKVEVNPDLSGMMEFYNNGVFEFGIVWNSDGSWSWFNQKL